MLHSYIPSDTGQLFVTHSGHQKDAIIFVHGATADWRIWSYQIKGLSPEYTSVAFDLLGFGKSDKPEIAYNFNLWAQNIETVREALGLRSVYLAGHSNGVPVVREYYRRWPERVKAMIFLDGPLYNIISPGMEDWMRTTAQRADYPQFMAQLLRKQPVPSLSQSENELLAEGAEETPAHVVLSQLDALMEDKLWAEDVINVPVLAIYTPSIQWPQEQESKVRKFIPHLDYQEWPEAGHFLSLQYPSKVNREIRQFIQTHKGKKLSV